MRYPYPPLYDVTRQPVTPIRKRKRSLPEKKSLPLDWARDFGENIPVLDPEEWKVNAQRAIRELPRKAGEALRKFLDDRPEIEKPNRRELLGDDTELFPDELEDMIGAAREDRFAKHRVESYLTNLINKLSVARTVFWVDDVFSKDLPRYGRDIAPKSYFLKEDGSIDFAVEAEEILLPRVTLPMVVDLETKGVNMHLYEDAVVVGLIEAAVCKDHTIVAERLDLFGGPRGVDEAIAKLEEHQLPLGCILYDPQLVPSMAIWPGFHIEDGIRANGVVGMYRGLPIRVSPFVSKNRIYVLPAPRYAGVLAFSSNLHLAFTGHTGFPVAEEVISAAVMQDNYLAVVIQRSNLAKDTFRRNAGCGLLGRDMPPEAIMWQVIPPSLPGQEKISQVEPGS